jgi:hypothetical protein
VLFAGEIMSECDDCRLLGRKCVVARILASITALSLYGLVLAILGGAIVWLSLDRGLSNDSVVFVVITFLGIELILFLMGGTYAPGLWITVILFGSLILWIKQQTTYGPTSKTGRQIIRDAILPRNIAVATA